MSGQTNRAPAGEHGVATHQQPDQGPDPKLLAQRLAAQQREALHLAETIAPQLDAACAELIAAGWTYQAVGQLIGSTRQQVWARVQRAHRNPGHK